jgi:ParB-like chromosome segregation protein Spo0J
MCGALIVAKKGSSYLVVDGGNRLRAARENGKIDTMPCMVFDN